jgi:hypothetical protein
MKVGQHGFKKEGSRKNYVRFMLVATAAITVQKEKCFKNNQLCQKNGTKL